MESFTNTFKLSQRWFRQFKSAYQRRGYVFYYNSTDRLELVYENRENGEHVLTYNNVTGETYTDWSLSKLLAIMEDMGGVSSPMSTLSNTPGMGNAVPPSAGGIGSGDVWGDVSIAKKTNEDNISPYDKLGNSIAKKMGVKTPFTKKKSKTNQNGIVSKKFEHVIIPLDAFLNENDVDNESYKKMLFDFLDAPWQEDYEIYFIELLNEYREKFKHSTISLIRDYLKNVLEANDKILQYLSDSFMNSLSMLIDVREDMLDVNESAIWTKPKRV